MNPPLPSGWRLEGEWLYDMDSYPRHVRPRGSLDRLLVGTILKNHGYDDHARPWMGIPALEEVAAKAEAFMKAFIIGGTADNPATLSALESLAAALAINKKQQQGKE